MDSKKEIQRVIGEGRDGSNGRHINLMTNRRHTAGDKSLAFFLQNDFLSADDLSIAGIRENYEQSRTINFLALWIHDRQRHA